MENLIFDTDYESGISAVIDWVGGGNFDGYIYKSKLRFYQENNLVVMNTQILESSRYDGIIEDKEIRGRYEWTDHKTITCFFGEIKMRGKFLGANNQFIAFSTKHSKSSSSISKCYELSKN